MNSLFKTITGGLSEANDQDISPNAKPDISHKKSTIFIKDLELEMLIGVLAHEKTQKQRVIVNVEAEVEAKDQWQNDDINKIVSYADIINHIERIAHEGHINLVETFTEKIAESCLAFELVTNVRVSVQKPDIIGNVKSVGAEIFVTKAP